MGNRHSIHTLQLFIVSVEHLYNSDMKLFIPQLQSENRLTRLVFDEGYISVLWKDFKSFLRNLNTTLSSLNIRVPKILLTAICPPCQRKSLVSQFNINNITLYSSPTVRKNLSYHFFNIDNVNLEEHRNMGKSKKNSIRVTEMTCKLGREQFDSMASANIPCRIMNFSMTRHICHDIGSSWQHIIHSSKISIYESGLPMEQRNSIQD